MKGLTWEILNRFKSIGISHSTLYNKNHDNIIRFNKNSSCKKILNINPRLTNIVIRGYVECLTTSTKDNATEIKVPYSVEMKIVEKNVKNNKA